ncbi:helix-turn-helix transcriptional regulator [Streptomyces sp. NPDC056069]|uniref:helix-turn-helix transcriptional regulator n=1 Tax=Streptomyces sp. NPDC056069 TaxID=3345702 RepID=UPI0035DBA8F8
MTSMNKAALKALLRERRGLIEPEDHGLTRPTGQGRRARGLSQHQVDELTGRATHTYNRLETGKYPNPPVDYLRQVARLFGLNEQEWGSLCRYAGIGDPPSPLSSNSGLEVPGVWQEAVDGISHMAYVTNASWDLLAHNQPWADLFPGGRIPRNTMRWMLLDPDGRDTLLEWRTVWAPLVLPQLQAALALRPDDETLLQIAKEARADPDLAPLWNAGGAHIHPDGDERPILHAQHGPGHVTMCAAQPMTAPGARLIILIYHPGQEKKHSRVPMLRARDNR